MEFQSKLSSARIGSNKSIKLLSEIENITKFYKSLYFKMVNKAAFTSKHRKGLKILTIKQMLQRLPIALAQVKAGNTSENLLNEVCQIIYSLYQEK